MIARAAVTLWSAALCCVAVPASAWGPEGHRVVCDIALQEAGPAARQLVARMMDGDAEDSTFAEACNWPDRLKNDPRFDWVKPLHYVNIRAHGSFDAKANCRAEGCVPRAIGQNARVLADSTASKPERRAALKYLAHFLGDLHQPLHVSYASDGGGNGILTWFCTPHCDTWKLHAVWDSGIIQASGESWQTLAHELRAQITDAQRAAWRQLDVEAITAETFALAESRAYHAVKDGAVVDGYIGNLPQPVALGASYTATMSPLVREQLAKAGVRLAMALDAVAAGRAPAELTRVAPLHATPSPAAGHGAPVRAQPRTSSQRLVTLAPGERLEILGEFVVKNAPHWYVVRLADGRQGFVRADDADVGQ